MTPIRLKLSIVGVFTVFLAQGAVAMQPRAWNSEYAVWQRGEFVVQQGSGMPTADQTRNGGCIGSTIEVSKQTLNAEERAQLEKSPLIKTPPRYAKKVKWIVAPTAGEGRKGGSVNYCSGGTEDWVDFVAPTLGQTVTTMGCIWTTSGDLGFYMYASQWTGQRGKNGGVGSLFEGTGAGIDNTSFPQEILHRSPKMQTSSVPQCFSYTFKFNNVEAIAPDNGLIIGMGFDFQDLKEGTEIHLTAVDFQTGSKPEPWEPTPDDLAQQLSKSRYQSWGPGVTGFTVSPTEILVNLPYQGAFTPTQPITIFSTHTYPPPSIAAVMLIDPSPVFQVGVKTENVCPSCGSKSAAGAKIVSQKFGPGGGYIVIGGFSDLPVGVPVVSEKPTPFVQIEYW